MRSALGEIKLYYIEVCLEFYTDDRIIRKREAALHHENSYLSSNIVIILIHPDLLTLKFDLENVVPVKLSAVARFKSITNLGGVGA